MADLTKLLDRPIAYHRAFVPFAGVSGAILLSQALYWSNRTDNSGWFYKTREEWQEETGLGRKAQEGARERLRELGILEEDLKGLPAMVYFRVNREVLSAVLEANFPVGTKGTTKVVPYGTNKVVPKGTNKLVQKVPPLYTETTTETTIVEERPLVSQQDTNISNESLESLESLVPVGKNSKNSLLALTDLERWELAWSMKVPLKDVKQVEDAFWHYVEDPKLRKKYKTSYLTIRKWIRGRLEKGTLQEINEMEEMLLKNDHPDKIALRNWAKEQALKRGDI